jgi:hypothetical protein
MTALSLLRLCQIRGVELHPAGGRIVLRGPKAARELLRDLVAEHTLELLAVLAAPPTPATTPLPSDGPGQQWARDWQGKAVNLAGLRKPGGVQ